MKLEENMYVRTKYGISKIISNPNESRFNIDIFKKDGITLRCIREKDVFKASHNIIDLIEEKDVIKFEYDGTEYICDVYEYSGRKDDLVVCCETNVIHIKEVNDRFELKSIVTKEQFESMSYKVQ